MRVDINWLFYHALVSMDPPHTPFCKNKNNEDKDSEGINIKLCSNPEWSKSNTYDFKMIIF